MTRARALKQVIRARAAKTGERYTAARRHVLRELNQPAEPKGSAPHVGSAPQVSSAPRATAAPTKGALSEAKTLEKTGKSLSHWFEVLDKFGAVAKGHTAAARLLYEDYGVPGWYCQGITVAYERARGVRAVNQRCDGKYEVSASKTVAAKPLKVIKAIADARWTDGVDRDLVKALIAAAKDKKKGFVIRERDGLGRCRYKWNDTTVQLYLIPKGDKTAVTVQHTNLAGASGVDEFRAKWKAALGALADHLK
jgi:hypothetical protein